MNKYLIKLADHLDKKGLHKEADYVDWIIKNSGKLQKKCPEIPATINKVLYIYNLADRYEMHTYHHGKTGAYVYYFKSLDEINSFISDMTSDYGDLKKDIIEKYRKKNNIPQECMMDIGSINISLEIKDMGSDLRNKIPAPGTGDIKYDKKNKTIEYSTSDIY